MWTKCLLQRAPSSHLNIWFGRDEFNFRTTSRILSKKNPISKTVIIPLWCDMRYMPIICCHAQQIQKSFDKFPWSLLDSFCWVQDSRSEFFMINDQTESFISEHWSEQQNITMTVIKNENEEHNAFQGDGLWIHRSLGLTFYCFWPRHHDPNLSVLPEIKKKMRHITRYLPHIIRYY